jgi:hypothetical protein
MIRAVQGHWPTLLRVIMQQLCKQLMCALVNASLSKSMNDCDNG